MPDPEFDDKPACAPESRCGGTGWVQVTEAYVERVCPLPEVPPPMTDAEQEAQEVLFAEVERRREAVRDSYYPCRQCSEAAFFRWAGRHFLPDHDAEHCGECRGRRKTKRAAS